MHEEQLKKYGGDQLPQDDVAGGSEHQFTTLWKSSDHE